MAFNQGNGFTEIPRVRRVVAYLIREADASYSPGHANRQPAEQPYNGHVERDGKTVQNG